MAQASFSPRRRILPPRRPDRGDREFSGGSRHQPSRSEVPTPGRWIRSDRHPGPVASRPRCRRLVDLSSSNSIRWRPRADPGQKPVPGERITQKGIDRSRPVTEARMEQSEIRVIARAALSPHCAALHAGYEFRSGRDRQPRAELAPYRLDRNPCTAVRGLVSTPLRSSPQRGPRCASAPGCPSRGRTGRASSPNGARRSPGRP